jgi:hypothetical protein
MIHRMTEAITLQRTETVMGERNRVTATELPPRTVFGCIRDVQSAWNRQGTDPVEWEFKASLAFPVTEDVKVNDRLTLGSHGVFVVVDIKRGRQFLAVTAVQWKRGSE